MSTVKDPEANAIQRLLRRYRGRLRRGVDWFRGTLWVKPVLYSLLAVSVVFGSGFADLLPDMAGLPEIPNELISALMSVLTASMLGVATFAVASMVSAYASVGNNATPRAFSLIVADDMSKRALSTFVGAFIFGTIGMIAIHLKWYDAQGRIALFSATLVTYGWVIWTFVSWVDSVARLGRMETAIKRLESATREALEDAGSEPTRGAREAPADSGFSHVVDADEVGYVVDFDLDRLQDAAREADAQIEVVASPGHFVGPSRALVRANRPVDRGAVVDAFVIGSQRTFTGDPRFGLVALSQVGSRALSPGVNDPGTAIDVFGSVTRLILEWSRTRSEARASEDETAPVYEDVFVPVLSAETLLDDAYTSMARYGAGHLEVSIRLQRDLGLLAASGDPELRAAAIAFSSRALARCQQEIAFDDDLKRVEAAAADVTVRTA